MRLKKLIPRFLFLSIPYILFIMISMIMHKPWFLQIDRQWMIWISIGFWIMHAVVYFQFAKEMNSFISGFVLFQLIALPFLFIFFPVLDLRLGDGILLRENMYLETKILGHQLTIDELFPALIHSTIFQWTSGFKNDPEITYRWLSTFTGFLFIASLMYFIFVNKLRTIVAVIPFASMGMLLFFGYVENYTIVTFIHFLIIAFGYTTLKKKTHTELRDLLIIASLAGVSFLFHVVSGYLLFALVYYCYIISDRNFLRNSIFSSFIAVAIIGSIASYFVFFSDVRVDFSLSHISNPSFYSIGKMFSIGHFKDLFILIFFTSFLSAGILFFEFIFHTDRIIDFFSKSQNKFLLLICVGFFLNSFAQNPLLGYPADWDLISFYWLSLSILVGVYLSDNYELSGQYFPLYVLSFILLISNAYIFNKRSPQDELELKALYANIEEFTKAEKQNIQKMKPEEKKFYLKTSYFLFNTKKILLSLSNLPKSKDLLEQNQIYYKELNERVGQFDSKWKKDLYKRMENYHKMYLDMKKEQIKQ